MNCNTRYRLEAPAEVIAALRAQFQEAALAMDEHGQTGEPCKWYGWREALEWAANQFNDCRFTLYGHGTEPGEDLWRCMVINGVLNRREKRVQMWEAA